MTQASTSKQNFLELVVSWPIKPIGGSATIERHSRLGLEPPGATCPSDALKSIQSNQKDLCSLSYFIGNLNIRMRRLVSLSGCLARIARFTATYCASQSVAMQVRTTLPPCISLRSGLPLVAAVKVPHVSCNSSPHSNSFPLEY